MSTIFDALKRSDRERQMNTTHTLSYSHLHSEKKSFPWLNYLLWAVFMLLFVFTAVYFSSKIFVNDSQDSSIDTKKVTPEPAVEETSSVNDSIKINSMQAIEIENLQEPEIEIDNVFIETEPRPSLAEVAKAPPTPTLEVIVEDASSNNFDTSEIAETQVEEFTIQNDFIAYENYSTVRSSKNLPDLHLDVLMYHPNVSQRKVFINLKAYKQGEKTLEGAEILKISEQGVLLNYQGLDFVLSTN